MAQVVVREIQDETFASLRRRAKRHGRSLEAEIRMILDEAVRTEDAEKVWASVDRFRTALARRGRRFADSAALVREDRRR